MKQLIAIALILIIVACHHTARKVYDKKIPAISMLLVDSATRIHTDDIPEGEPVVFMYFRPDCPHCQEETSEFIANMASLKGIRLYMLTPTYQPLLKEFCRFYKLDSYSNIKVGVDEGLAFYKYYEAKHIPFLAIFNKDRRLVKIKQGPMPVRDILKSVSE